MNIQIISKKFFIKAVEVSSINDEKDYDFVKYYIKSKEPTGIEIKQKNEQGNENCKSNISSKCKRNFRGKID